MRNNSADKVKQIINEEFDSRMSGAVVSYIISAGWENVKVLTEEDILEEKGNGFISDEFCQSLLRCAVKITNECNLFDDFIPYIIMENFNNNVPVRNLKLEKENFDSDFIWIYLLERLCIYDENTSYVELGAFVKVTDAEEE